MFSVPMERITRKFLFRSGSGFTSSNSSKGTLRCAVTHATLQRVKRTHGYAAHGYFPLSQMEHLSQYRVLLILKNKVAASAIAHWRRWFVRVNFCSDLRSQLAQRAERKKETLPAYRSDKL